MELKQLESFVAVVKYKSFTQAAKHLYISQPTISSHIQMLEEELKSCLIIRSTKNFEITPRGLELYQCASDMLALRDNLLKSWDGDHKKVIQLGVSTIPSAYIIPELLPAYGNLFPDVYFNVHQNDSQGIIAAMNSGKYDIGMIGVPCDDRQLVCCPFFQDRMVLITPVNEYFLSLKETSQVSLEVFLQNPVILRENGNGSPKRADRFLESMGISADSLNIVARVNDQEAIKNLTAGGLGISFISEKAAQNFVNEKRLLSFPLPESVAAKSLYLVAHKNDYQKPYVSQFFNFARHYYL